MLIESYTDFKTLQRWLWRQGRRKEAIEVLQWMARINRRSFDEKLMNNLEREEEQKLMIEKKVEVANKERLFDVFKYPRKMDILFVNQSLRCIGSMY